MLVAVVFCQILPDGRGVVSVDLNSGTLYVALCCINGLANVPAVKPAAVSIEPVAFARIILPSATDPLDSAKLVA